MIWSLEQQAVFQWMETSEVLGQKVKNILVKARAGTGKTTTIKHGLTTFAPEDSILYAVFGKRNQLEAEEKIKDSRVEVRTLHSVGFGFLKDYWGRNVKPDSDVEYDRIREALAQLKISIDDEDRESFAALFKGVSLSKNSLTCANALNIRALLKANDVECSLGDDECALVVGKVLELSRKRRGDLRISFDDMVWLPVALDVVKKKYDLVVVDEAQDMNAPQLAIARGCVRAGGRVCVVGDDRQAIYGFRGAAQGGMMMMKAVLRAAELTLNTTYRCPKAVVREAAKIVPDYRAAESAPEGEVSWLNDAAFHAEVKVGDVILSRLNAPLMPLALSLIRRKVPARIEGRDVGAQLQGYIDSIGGSGLKEFLTLLDVWESAQVEKINARHKGNVDRRIEQVRDVAETLRALCEGCDFISAVEKRIKEMFEDSDKTRRPAVILSSVHKAKGMEWPRVFVLRDTFMRRNSDDGAAEKSEELNIYYVAVTRAQKSLFFIGKRTEEADAPPYVKEAMLNLSDPEAKVITLRRPERPAVPQKFSLTKLMEEQKLIPVAPSVIIDNWEEPLPGNVWLTPGTVIRTSFDAKGTPCGPEYVSIRLSQSGATIKALNSTQRESNLLDKSGNKRIMNVRPEPQHISRQISRENVVRVMSADEFDNFTSRGARRAVDHTNSSGQENETEQMKNKTTAKKKTGGEKTEGKMAFIERHLLLKGGERMTKSDIVAATMKQFPGSAEKTIKNSVQWVASCGLQRKGKVSNHLPEERATPAKAAPTRKAAPKGKAAAPTRPAAKSPKAAPARAKASTKAAPTKAPAKAPKKSGAAAPAPVVPSAPVRPTAPPAPAADPAPESAPAPEAGDEPTA